MRILQLISSAGQYGAENVVVELAVALGGLGCRSTVGVFENQHKPNIEVLKAAERRGLETVRIPCAGRLDRNAIRKIREFIDEHSIDLVHSHGYKSNLYGYLGARAVKVPVVSTCHGWPGKTQALRLYYTLDRLLLKRFDQVVAVSDAIGDTLREKRIAEERIERIDNGIDVERFANVPAERRQRAQRIDGTRIGFVGRLAPEKGLVYLLTAAQSVVRQYPRVRFHLVGDGPDLPQLKALTKQLEIEDNIIFAGYSKDIRNALVEFDVFVLPSTTEGMPMALLEAMAAGTPVIASRVGAIPTIVIPNQTGLLVEPGDVRSLEAALLQYLRDPAFAGKMGASAAEMVHSRYSSAKMAQSYLDVYRRTITGRRLRAAPLECDA